jgi:NitT/TauT family transport system substrate-binding protein
MYDEKWEASIDVLAEPGDLQRRPTAREMYANDILAALPEAKQLSKLVVKAARSR